MPRGQQCELFVRPIVRPFRQGQEQALLQCLRHMEMQSTREVVTGPDSLAMDDNGKTREHGYRYTHSGFIQVAQALAKGLSNVLADLAGMVHRKDDRDHLADSVLAIKWFNEMVGLRLGLLTNYKLLLNHEEQLVEGLVGARQQFLSNDVLYSTAAEYMQHYHPATRLYTAIIIGRRMAVWFRDAEPLFRLAIVGGEAEVWPFYRGYCFGNGEASGTAVRGTLAILYKYGLCLGPYRVYGDRVMHVGKDFAQRLGRLFDKVLTRPLPVLLETMAQALQATNLGFAGLDAKAQRAQERRMAYGLHQLGVQKNLARAALEHAMYTGCDNSPGPRSLRRLESALGSRTMLDLFVALTQMARQLDLDRREKIEQAAFALLTGKFMI